MANTLMECCLSEAHARAVIAEFSDAFPTPGDVRGVAYNTRNKFQKQMKEVWPALQGSGFVSKTIKGITRLSVSASARAPSTR